MLTAKQKVTYEFIRDYMKRHGLAPTETEIAAGIGIRSRGVVHRYVKALESAGLIRLVPQRHRNIQLCEDNTKAYGVPILGHVAAGQPIEAVLDHDYFDLQSTLLRGDRYLLAVKGDSMLGDCICDGDYAICEPSTQVSSKEIAVVLIDGQEATLKRVQKSGSLQVALLPSNPEFEVQLYNRERVSIQGRYVGLLRWP